MKLTKKYGKKADTALQLWVKLARAAATFGKLSSENIRTFGLTEPQFGVIECLGHLGPLKLNELSKKMIVTAGNITCVIDNLQKEHLVERIKNNKDRRVIVVRLTPKGQKLFKSIFTKHAEYISKLASVLNEQEQKQLASLLKRLGLALTEQFPRRNKQKELR
ncbi:MAG: MarR family transcriptional regulator [Ignavibacteriales bacterium]|nr:MarR family transcriptional regulator [Ignavibacteriales bacterium]